MRIGLSGMAVTIYFYGPGIFARTGYVKTIINGLDVDECQAIHAKT